MLQYSSIFSLTLYVIIICMASIYIIILIVQCYNYCFIQPCLLKKLRKENFYTYPTLFYIYPHIYHFQSSSFLPVDSSYHLLHYFSTWRTSFRTSYRAGLCLAGNSFISPLLLKDNFARYRSWDWNVFFFQPLKYIIPHFLLTSTVSGKNCFCM